MAGASIPPIAPVEATAEDAAGAEDEVAVLLEKGAEGVTNVGRLATDGTEVEDVTGASTVTV